MKQIAVFIIFVFLSSCSTKMTYEHVSEQIDALQNESKAVVNLDLAAKKLLEAQEFHQSKLEELEKVRETNRKNGMPLGPELEKGLSVREEIEALKKIEKGISDQTYELKQQREKIITRETK